MNKRWIKYFLDRAELTASMSKDPSTKVGSIIVDPKLKQEISSGYNGFPREVSDDFELYSDRDEKYSRVVHAEANAIVSAARLGISTDGCWLFCTHMPCSGCAGLIINAGITKVITIEETQTSNDPHWKFYASEKLFNEAAIALCKETL